MLTIFYVAYMVSWFKLFDFCFTFSGSFCSRNISLLVSPLGYIIFLVFSPLVSILNGSILSPALKRSSRLSDFNLQPELVLH